MRRTGTLQIRLAHDGRLLYRNELAGAVSLPPLLLFRVDLYHLTVIGAVGQAVRNGVHVGLETIGANLEPARSRRPPNLGDEVFGVDAIPPSEMPRKHQLGRAFQSDERVGVADFVIVRLKRKLVRFFLLKSTTTEWTATLTFCLLTSVFCFTPSPAC